MRERDWRAACGRCAEDLGGRRSAFAGIDHGLAVGGELHVVKRRSAAHDYAARSATGRNHLDTLPSAIEDGEEQHARIRRPGEALHRPVERVGYRVHLSGRAFEHEQTPSVALITRTLLAPIS